MAYLDQMDVTGPDGTAQINARIGGMRKKVNDRKLAIAEHCIASYRADAAMGGEIAAWCREAIELEDQIKALLEQIQRLKYQQSGYLEQLPPVYAERPLPPPSPPKPSAPVFVESVAEPTSVIPAPAPQPVPASFAPPAAPPPVIPMPKPKAPTPAPTPAPEPVYLAPSAPTPEPVTAAPAPVAPEPRTDPTAELISCAACGVKNPKGTRFCQDCGMKLESVGIQCPVCHTVNPGDTKFCLDCGTRLESGASSPAIQTGPPAPQANVYCPECGAINEPGTKFCGDCGLRM